MAVADEIQLGIMIITGVATLFALLNFYSAFKQSQEDQRQQRAAQRQEEKQYQEDQRQQRAAQIRADLKEIYGDCHRFAYPLNQKYPYPILHTATAISKEFRSRLGASPKPEDVLSLFRSRDKELLTSIGVEGWISSTQVHRLMNIVEDLEHKAASPNIKREVVAYLPCILLACQSGCEGLFTRIIC